MDALTPTNTDDWRMQLISEAIYRTAGPRRAAAIKMFSSIKSEVTRTKLLIDSSVLNVTKRSMNLRVHKISQ